MTALFAIWRAITVFLRLAFAVLILLLTLTMLIGTLRGTALYGQSCNLPHPPSDKQLKLLSCELSQNPKSREWKVQVSAQFHDSKTVWHKKLETVETEEEAYKLCQEWRRHVLNTIHVARLSSSQK